jgi:predicted enzyme related to lactoylglutathione lyase
MSTWPRPVVQFSIHAKDRRRQAAFYRELFDWDMQEQAALPVIGIPPGKGPPEDGIGGHIIESDHAPAITVYIQVADLRATLDRAVVLGGTRVLEPFDVPNGPTVAQIKDPEGNLLGLVQQ